MEFGVALGVWRREREPGWENDDLRNVIAGLGGWGVGAFIYHWHQLCWSYLPSGSASPLL